MYFYNFKKGKNNKKLALAGFEQMASRPVAVK